MLEFYEHTQKHVNKSNLTHTCLCDISYRRGLYECLCVGPGPIGHIQTIDFSVLYGSPYKLVVLGYVLIPCVVFFSIVSISSTFNYEHIF